ncbi:MAG TPA: protein phosphatase 2C domain-containing protein [Pyrinomonadaceae bacterium]|nr:protein phosphatase 2C domain-containing protein [Pyrinomonadaceae bacterium]
MSRQNELSLPASLNEQWACLKVDLGAASHQGHVRENNEDSYLVMKFGRSLENLLTNVDDDLLAQDYVMNGYGLLVADGMGGMAGGDVASRLALHKLIELIVDTPDWILALRQEQDIRIVLNRMTERFLQVDDILRKEAELDHTLLGMGTTLTVAGALGNDLIIGHVGDSRAYLLRGDNFDQLTTDHTLAQALIDAGVADRNDPASRSMRHVLTAAVGSLGEQVEPQVQRFKLLSGDQLLLCTDGLTETVEDATIAGVLRQAESAQSACQELIDLALDGGGADNITVVIAHFVSPSMSGDSAGH